jgi:hypothetical protein
MSYAQALFEVTQEQNLWDVLPAQLAQVSGAVGNTSQLVAAFAQPGLTPEDKQQRLSGTPCVAAFADGVNGKPAFKPVANYCQRVSAIGGLGSKSVARHGYHGYAHDRRSTTPFGRNSKAYNRYA